MSNHDWVFGLNVMNISLGIAVVVPLLIMAYGVASELVNWLKNRRCGARHVRKETLILSNEFAHTFSGALR
jgi:hypothetical protein